MNIRHLWEPKKFYSIIASLSCIPISLSLEYIAGFFFFVNLFLLIRFNDWYLTILSSHFDSPILKVIIRVYKFFGIIILPIINFFISYFFGLTIHEYTSFKIEGNVFAFTLIFIFIPYCILYLIAVIRYFLFLKPLTKEPTINQDIVRDIKIDKKDKILNIIIYDKYNTNFDTLKQKLIEQFYTKGYTNTVIDRNQSWMVKNKNMKSYVQLTYKNHDFIIEIFNMEESNNEINSLMSYIKELHIEK